MLYQNSDLKICNAFTESVNPSSLNALSTEAELGQKVFLLIILFYKMS